jgi:hypothetical protein
MRDETCAVIANVKMILVIYDDNESHAYRCFVAEQSTRIEQ